MIPSTPEIDSLPTATSGASSTVAVAVNGLVGAVVAPPVVVTRTVTGYEPSSTYVWPLLIWKILSVGVPPARTTGTTNAPVPSPQLTVAVSCETPARVLGLSIVASRIVPVFRSFLAVKLKAVPVNAGSVTVAVPGMVTTKPPTSVTTTVVA